jgi:hypothetical protein
MFIRTWFTLHFISETHLFLLRGFCCTFADQHLYCELDTMAIIKTGDRHADPILTRLVQEDKVSATVHDTWNTLLTVSCADTMVQEAESSDHVPLSLLLLHGRRDDFRLRLSVDQHTAVLHTFQHLYASF